jgi:hypothetical protein
MRCCEGDACNVKRLRKIRGPCAGGRQAERRTRLPRQLGRSPPSRFRETPVQPGASRYTIRYTASSGRFCQARTSSSTASVTLEMRGRVLCLESYPPRITPFGPSISEPGSSPTTRARSLSATVRHPSLRSSKISADSALSGFDFPNPALRLFLRASASPRQISSSLESLENSHRLTFDIQLVTPGRGPFFVSST